MPPPEFIDRLKNRLATAAVGASTLRRQGAAGVVDAAREGLRHLDLHGYTVSDEAAFLTRLDADTESLRGRFPEGTRTWGGARKALNIFLRDDLYNIDLSDHYKLQHLRPWLEVPLDSHVAAGLRAEPEGK